MSAVEVNRLFEDIEDQYENDGVIDPQKKAMLLEEMKKFSGGEKFVQQISAAFQQIENSDDDDTESSDTRSIVKSRLQKLKFNVALKVFNLFLFSCQVSKNN